ncbi:MAG: hypothetical protein U1F43_34950 [Myxococcota bacterium]
MTPRALALALAGAVSMGCGARAPGPSEAVPTGAAPAATAATGSALAPNDVSVLFPAAPAEALWPASSAARGGVLLPRSEVDRLGLSLVREVEDGDEYDALRVVAARFDPCFRTAFAAPCQPQIRLVFQIPDPAGGFYDGALHALYALAPGELDAIARELRALAALAPENVGAPLGPSPALTRQGLKSPYAARLFALVTGYAGQASLVRMTFISRTFARSGQWQMGGFVTGGGKLAIAGIGATQQNVTRTVGHAFDYTVAPAFADPAGRPGASADRLDALAPEAQAEVHAWAVRQEDPSQHLPDTTDCASCHIGQHVARHLEERDPSLASPPLAAERGARTISLAESDADNLRAFGWVGKEPHVAQRTANETRAVLAAFAALP